MNVPYQIIKSNRKTIAIQIKPDGQVVVRCFQVSLSQSHPWDPKSPALAYPKGRIIG